MREVATCVTPIRYAKLAHRTARMKSRCGLAARRSKDPWSIAILAVGPAGILSAAGRTRCGEPAGSRLAGETPASTHRLEACAPPHLDNVWQN